MIQRTRYDVLERVAFTDEDDNDIPSDFYIVCPKGKDGRQEDGSISYGERVLWVPARKAFLSFSCYSDARTVVDALNAALEAEKNLTDQRDAAIWCAESGNALVKQLKDQIAEAKAENERLRKAGDAMAAIIRPPAHGPGEWEGEYDAWLAAKGVQS